MGQDIVDSEMNVNQLAAVVSGILSPLAARNAETQQAAIKADVEKLKLSLDASDRASARSYNTALATLFIAAVSIAGFFFANRPDFALNALMFFGGSAAGYGLGARKKHGE